VRDILSTDCSRQGLAREKWFLFRRFEEKIEELFGKSRGTCKGLEDSMHVAFSPTLEQTFMPDANRIVEACGQLVGW
jgi:hypothetical protein